jgi:hypothetical protein
MSTTTEVLLDKIPAKWRLDAARALCQNSCRTDELQARGNRNVESNN